MSHFMEGKLKKISVDRWWRVNDVIIESVEALETRYSIILNGSDVIFQKNKNKKQQQTKNNNKTTTLSVSAHTTQSVKQ